MIKNIRVVEIIYIDGYYLNDDGKIEESFENRQENYYQKILS